jgi:hypothetical protein
MFALIMWETLHGKLVWNQFNTAQANQQVMKMNLPEFDQSVLDSTPAQVVSLINQCLSFDPAQRPSFSEVA